MKLLCKFIKSSGLMVGGMPDGLYFIDLPEECGSVIIEDAEMAAAMWFSHSNGGEVVITLHDDGTVTADVESVTVPEVKTPEQARIDFLESQNASIIFTLVMNDLM